MAKTASLLSASSLSGVSMGFPPSALQNALALALRRTVPSVQVVSHGWGRLGGSGFPNLSLKSELVGSLESKYTVLSCVETWARPWARQTGKRAALIKGATWRAKKKRPWAGTFGKGQETISWPGDAQLQPVSASPSGSLSPILGPFSPPLLASLLITWLSPIAQTLPVGPTLLGRLAAGLLVC